MDAYLGVSTYHTMWSSVGEDFNFFFVATLYGSLEKVRFEILTTTLTLLVRSQPRRESIKLLLRQE